MWGLAFKNSKVLAFFGLVGKHGAGVGNFASNFLFSVGVNVLAILSKTKKSFLLTFGIGDAEYRKVAVSS